MMRFIRLTWARTNKQSVNSQLNIGDMELAHRILIRVAQADLVKNNQSGSLRHQFSLYQDTEGIWRCWGRLRTLASHLNRNIQYFLRDRIT